ncbi:MAG: hypothetical protein WC236_07535 [Gallionellaceae bacterium]|jgi:hypothetical protein
MPKNLRYVLCLLVLPVSLAMAAGKGKNEDSEVKEVSGMSIVGNNETPKSLVIIPWKSSEIGQESKLNSNLLNDGLNPVDKAVFMRELNFHNLGNSK